MTPSSGIASAGFEAEPAAPGRRPAGTTRPRPRPARPGAAWSSPGSSRRPSCCGCSRRWPSDRLAVGPGDAHRHDPPRGPRRPPGRRPDLRLGDPGPPPRSHEHGCPHSHSAPGRPSSPVPCGWPSPAGPRAPAGDYTGIAAMILAFHLTGRHVEAGARGRASGDPPPPRARRPDRPVSGTASSGSADRAGGRRRPAVGAARREDPDRRRRRGGGELRRRVHGHRGERPRREAAGVAGDRPTVNGSGRLVIRATRVGEETFLAQVIRMVREAQASKVPVAELADRITGGSCRPWRPSPGHRPGLAGLSGALRPILRGAFSGSPRGPPGLDAPSLALFAAIAVLVISCPCALGLATYPRPHPWGSGKGAERGSHPPGAANRSVSATWGRSSSTRPAP